MDLELEGRTALVLGAGGGLGSAIASELADEGANIAAADINLVALNEIQKHLNDAGRKSLILPWDIADLSLVDRTIEQIETALGEVDILVNITGGPPPTPVVGQGLEEWESSFESMVLSIIKVTDRVVPGMRRRGWGRVITSTSSGVIAPIPNLGISNSLRSTLLGWSKSLSNEVAADGVTANIIVPGRIATDRIKYLDQRKSERENQPLENVVSESVQSIPAGRYGEPEEYADAVAFLASARASYINGSILRVDGGYIPSI